MDNETSGAVAEPIVRLKNVAISHDEVPLLSGVDLSIGQGEFVYLIGKSGAGKTSLLRALYADQPIAEGEATVCGIDVVHMRRRHIPQLRRRLGIVFQNARLLKDRTVGENLAFVLRATGWRRADIGPQVEKTLAAVGIGHKADAMPRSLSRMNATVEGGEPAGLNSSVGFMSSAMPVNAASNSSMGTLT